MKRKLALVSTLLVALFAVGHLQAAAQNHPCGDEVKKFCPAVTPGKGAILDCLKPHMSELSEGCRKAMETVENRRAAMAEHQRKARTMRAGQRQARPSATPAK